ncbi:MAG: DNA gyrase subunit A, partial [Clostridia bacterium]|nr:DNA gyrase subunit A [Clostridia bacterium]
FTEGEYLTMVTKKGVIKKTPTKDFEYQRRSGKIAITLDEGDDLLFVRKTKGDDDLILATRGGAATRFSETTVRPMGRGARGVRGIRLVGDDYVIGVALVEEGKQLLTITDRGFGKRTEFDDFRVLKNRGGQGVTAHNLNDKTGNLAAIAAVSESDDIMMITNDGTIIRIPVAGIPIYSRSAGGVIVMRLSEGAAIVNLSRIEPQEELDEEITADETAEHPELSESGEEAPDAASDEPADAGAEEPEDEAEEGEPEENEEL